MQKIVQAIWNACTHSGSCNISRTRHARAHTFSVWISFRVLFGSNSTKTQSWALGPPLSVCVHSPNDFATRTESKRELPDAIKPIFPTNATRYRCQPQKMIKKKFGDERLIGIYYRFTPVGRPLLWAHRCKWALKFKSRTFSKKRFQNLNKIFRKTKNERHQRYNICERKSRIRRCGCKQ